MNYLVNVSAFCLPLILLLYWGIIGYATLSLLRTSRKTLQNILLAPSIGISVNLLFIFWLNVASVPVGHFAILLSILMLTISFSILYYRRPIFALKHYLPFAALLLLALLVTGRPLLEYGYDWVSYSNDDMANYSLGAIRFLQHGYFEIPNMQEILAGKNFSLVYWFMHIPGMTRAGSEITLAWLSAITHLSPLQVFMPLIMAFHLLLISTVGALVYTVNSQRKIALTTMLLLCFSPLTSLGTLYQLIAQVFGLSLLAAIMVLVFDTFSIHKKNYPLSQALLFSAVLSALLIAYPEVSPFLFLAFNLYFLSLFIRGWRFNKAFFMTLSAAAVLTLLFLNVHVLGIFNFLITQAEIGSRAIDIRFIVFPYYLLPSGLANLWGLQAISVYSDEPWMSCKIIFSALLTLLALAATIRLVRLKSLPVAVMTLVMALVGILLFKKSSGFGLFKLAMFIQPFLLGVVTFSIYELIKHKGYKIALFALFILVTLPCLNFYIIRSRAEQPGAFSEIPYASTTKINHEYAELISKVPKDTIILSNDFNSSIIKFQALQSHHYIYNSLISPINFVAILNMGADYKSKFLGDIYEKVYHIQAAKLLAYEYTTKNLRKLQFNLFDLKTANLEFYNNYICDFSKNCANSVVVLDTALRGVINARHYPINSFPHNFVLENYRDMHNKLAFIDSSLGRIYYSSEVNSLNEFSLFNYENDYFHSDKIIQAIGRYLLFRVFNPSPTIRLEIAITNTFDKVNEKRLPAVSVIGNKRLSMAFKGRGSGRVFSPPFSPQYINGVPYVASDLNITGQRTPYERKWLSNIYNKQVFIDARYIVSYARDISLVSEEQYQQMIAPSAVSKFPQDLENNNLEYSGIYEDGWISEDAFFKLQQAPKAKYLKILGMFPQIENGASSSILTILLDGKKVAEQQLKPGDFNLSIPVNDHEAGRRNIDLHFSTANQISKLDPRIIAAKINFIGFG